MFDFFKVDSRRRLWRARPRVAVASVFVRGGDCTVAHFREVAELFLLRKARHRIVIRRRTISSHTAELPYRFTPNLSGQMRVWDERFLISFPSTTCFFPTWMGRFPNFGLITTAECSSAVMVKRTGSVARYQVAVADRGQDTGTAQESQLGGDGLSRCEHADGGTRDPRGEQGESRPGRHGYRPSLHFVWAFHTRR